MTALAKWNTTLQTDIVFNGERTPPLWMVWNFSLNWIAMPGAIFSFQKSLTILLPLLRAPNQITT